MEKIVLVNFLFVVVGINGAPKCGEPPSMEYADECCLVSKKPILTDIVKKCESTVKKELESGSGLDIENCVYDCIFNKTGMPKDGNFDVTKIIKPVQEKLQTEEEYLKFLITSFQICHPKVNSMISNTTVRCSPYASTMLFCVSQLALTNCPASKWQNNDDCNKIRDYIKACPFM